MLLRERRGGRGVCTGACTRTMIFCLYVDGRIPIWVCIYECPYVCVFLCVFVFMIE